MDDGRDMADYLQALGKTVGIIATICAAVMIIAKTPFIRVPVGFVWRQLISSPLSSWFRGLIRVEVNEVVDERLMRPNGGSSLHDISKEVRCLVEGQKDIKERLGVLEREDDPPPDPD